MLEELIRLTVAMWFVAMCLGMLVLGIALSMATQQVLMPRRSRRE